MSANSSSYPTLRDDLTWTLHQFADGTSYTVIDPQSGVHYQVGVAEYALASMLDGKTSPAEAAAATRALAKDSNSPELAVNDADAETIAKWFVRTDLATLGHGKPTNETSKGVAKTRISALCIKTPLGNPARIVEAMFRWTRPLATKLMLIVTIIAITLAIVQVMCDLGRWHSAMKPLADPNSWWILGGVALMLRVLHEAAHAVVARRFDVRVNEVGILWILLMPLPYVDVSESWQRNKRRQRILIAGAGMLAEMFAASIAVLVFSCSNSDLTQHLAASVAITASVVTLLFNANVLMRFDGYHMLVDAIGLPNLYSDASAYWRTVVARVVLGTRTSRYLAPPGWIGVFFRAYGLAAAGWRMIVFVGLVLAAEHLLGGIGAVMSFTAVAMLALRVLILAGRALRQSRPFRAAIGVTIATGVLIGLWHLPIAQKRTEPGVVQYANREVVRAESDGFVRQLLVQCGQTVKSGDPLIKLENAALETEVATLRIALAKAELAYRRFLAEEQLAAVEAQWSSMLQLQKQLDERQSQLDGLTIRSESDGVVDAPENLKLWLGRYVREGTELMKVVRRNDLEVVFLVDQPSREQWADRVGKTVHVRRPIRWQGEEATLVDIAPLATDQLPRDVLGAHQGGWLSVRPVSAESDSVRLLSPRFEARLKPTQTRDLRDGQRVFVTLGGESVTVGDAINESAGNWFHARVARHSVLRQLTNF